eukprot:1144410-Pelagomonas_calceolata.AAC.2
MNTSRSQVMEPASWWRGLTALLSQCSEGTRPGAQLEALQQQHSELCELLQGVEITLHTSSWV